MTITEFLLARIAEDEAAALEVPSGDEYRVESTDPDAKPWRVADHYRRHQPARVLAECEAKRRIVEQYEHRLRRASGQALFVGQREGLGLAITILASVYADHPDFDPAWR